MTHRETKKLDRLLVKYGPSAILGEISGLLDEHNELQKADDVDDCREKWD